MSPGQGRQVSLRVAAVFGGDPQKYRHDNGLEERSLLPAWADARGTGFAPPERSSGLAHLIPGRGKLR